MYQKWNAYWVTKTAQLNNTSWSKRRIQGILDRYLRQGLCVLDAGCGSGFFSEYFLSRDCDTYCLDYSPEALNLTRQLTKGRATGYIRTDLLEPSFAEDNKERFHLIFSDGLFEHFSAQEQDRIFTNFKKVKREGGIIITFVPNRYTLWRALQPLYMPGIKEQPLSLSELLGLYRRNSCTIKESGGINVLPIGPSPEFLGKWFGMLVYCIGE
jgi:cyclopropane fatty-acyl-phospholipid synthase-like methyltransferase